MKNEPRLSRRVVAEIEARDDAGKCGRASRAAPCRRRRRRPPRSCRCSYSRRCPHCASSSRRHHRRLSARPRVDTLCRNWYRHPVATDPPWRTGGSGSRCTHWQSLDEGGVLKFTKCRTDQVKDGMGPPLPVQDRRRSWPQVVVCSRHVAACLDCRRGLRRRERLRNGSPENPAERCAPERWLQGAAVGEYHPVADRRRPLQRAALSWWPQAVATLLTTS